MRGLPDGDVRVSCYKGNKGTHRWDGTREVARTSIGYIILKNGMGSKSPTAG